MGAIHSGHIEYLKSAKEYGDKLIVALNSDIWLEKKKGKPFMTFNERKSILDAIQYVDEVIDFEDDKDDFAPMQSTDNLKKNMSSSVFAFLCCVSLSCILHEDTLVIYIYIYIYIYTGSKR